VTALPKIVLMFALCTAVPANAAELPDTIAAPGEATVAMFHAEGAQV
jgi:hypothetical protein